MPTIALRGALMNVMFFTLYVFRDLQKPRVLEINLIFPLLFSSLYFFQFGLSCPSTSVLRCLRGNRWRRTRQGGRKNLKMAFFAASKVLLWLAAGCQVPLIIGLF